MKNAKPTDTQAITFSPAQAGRLTVDLVDELRNTKHQGVKTGLPDVDAILVPPRGGNLVTIIGYTSNMKSTFMDFLASEALKAITPESDEFVAKATWEQSVEEDTLGWMASSSGLSVTRMARGEINDAEFEVLQGASVRRAVTPLWIIGHSQIEYRNARRARPRMTMRDVARALEYVIHDATDHTLTPKAIFLDYLQRMRPDAQDGASRREQMMEAVNLCKDTAVAYGCPVYLGVQAGRDTLERDDKLPTLNDGQETSNIEQSSDVAFSVWYPIKNLKPGMIIDGYKVTPNLFFLRLLKQKLGDAPKTWALFVDPERRTFNNTIKKI